MDCARGLIQAGVKKVVCKENCTTKNKDKWKEQQERSLILLSECGVTVEFY
jgi:deoxycytidylate deaminase